nr:hypothetical protein B0A51_14939 [Rachicladosporium sp. CCFEE 5018]
MRRRYAWLLVGWACQDLANALAVPSGHDRDERVKSPHHRVKPQTVQLVSPNQNAPGKYFHEASFSGHYDGRFAGGKLPYDARREHLTALTHTYFKTMNDIGIETWLMHGSLLGWYWNRNALPWDSDIDVMVSERSIDHLANYYNMSMHHYAEPGRDGGRDYLLEINPHYHVDSTSDTTNVIDARWICTQTGLFIDITTLRRNRTAQEKGVDGAMMVKDNHHYMYDDIFPLRESTFEGVNTRVPFAYSDLLVEEYGPAALSKTTHENHRWDSVKQEWIPLSGWMTAYTGRQKTDDLEAAATSALAMTSPITSGWPPMPPRWPSICHLSLRVLVLEPLPEQMATLAGVLRNQDDLACLSHPCRKDQVPIKVCLQHTYMAKLRTRRFGLRLDRLDRS